MTPAPTRPRTPPAVVASRELLVPVVAVALHARTCPLAVRERAAFAPGRGAAAHVAERAEVAEALVLSTCNRIELYAATAPGERAATAERLMELLAERSGVPAAQLRAVAEVRTGLDAARHLCRVAAGLDSVVFGETQITGQLRRALADARGDGVLGPTLQRLGSTALAAGRRARPLVATPDGRAARGPVSVVDAALHAVGGAAGIGGRGVVVVGAGETARDVLALLTRAGARRVVIVNRSAPRAAALAARYGAEVAPWDALGHALAAADLVFACTAADAPVIRADHLAADVRERRAGTAGADPGDAHTRPVTVVDLGVPRNVAPDVRELPGVRVWDIDALAPNACPMRGAMAAVDASAAEAEADRWARRFARWVRSREAVPTIAQLRAAADAVREHEVARALARLDGLSAREQEVVRAMAARLVNKLLHAPVAALAAEPRTHEAAARRLFALDAAPASAADEHAGDERAPEQAPAPDGRRSLAGRPRLARRALAS